MSRLMCKCKILIVLSIHSYALTDLVHGQTSPSRHSSRSIPRRNSPDPNDIDWSDLQDIIPVHPETLNPQSSGPVNPSFGFVRHGADPNPSITQSRSYKLPVRPYVSPEQNLEERRKRRNQQRRESNARLKSQQPEKHQEKLKKQRMAMANQKANMTKEQEEIFKEKRRKWQKIHSEKRLAQTGSRNSNHAELIRLRGLEKDNQLSIQDKEKLTSIRKKQLESSRRYSERKRSKKRPREPSN